MAFVTSRREFLRLAAVAGASVPALLGRSEQSGSPQLSGGQAGNGFFTVAFDPASGEINIRRNNGDLLLSRAHVRVFTLSGPVNSSDSRYDRSYEISNVPDAVIGGRRLTARCLDRKKQLDLEWRVTLLDGFEGVVVEAVCHNGSSQPVVVRSIQPIRAAAAEGGSCGWRATTKLLTNGQLYSDAGKVKEIKPGEVVGSWWNVAFYAGDDRECLLAGYLENKTSQGQISVQPAE